MPTPSRPRSLPTLSALLIKLVLACLLPALLGVGIMIYMDYERDHTQLEENTRRSVQDKLETVDAQLAQAELFAQTLATNASLIQQDFATFHQKSLRLLKANNLNFTVFVYDASGQQLINTGIPYGERLLKRQDIANIQSVFASGQMMRSHIALRTSDGQPTVGILVPVFAGKKVIYALSVGFSPKNLNRLVEVHALQADGIAAIIDSNGAIASRSTEAEKIFGKKVSPQLLKKLETQSEGVFELTTFAGTQVLTTYRRSPRTDWTVVIAIPKKIIQTSLTRNLVVLVLGGMLLLGLSLGSAWVVGKRIAKSVRALHDAAVALGTGELTDMTAGATNETHELSQALQASAQLLIRRTQQLEAANANLLERSTELNEAQHIAHIGNWKWDAGTGVFFVSDELQRLYGQKILLPFAELKDKVFANAAWQELKTAAKATRQSKAGFALLLLTMAENDSQIWTRVSGEAVCNAAGEVTGLRGTLQNVDAYVKGEMALIDNAKRYRALFDESPEAIVVHLNGSVAFTNTSAVKLFEAAAEADLAGLSLNKFVHPDFQQAVAARMPSITQAGERVPPLELKFITLKGQTFSAQARSKELLLDGQRFVQTHIQDLTESKRHAADMARLRTELQDILAWQVAQHTVAALAHEVNQPLASASILCEVASRMLVIEGLSDDAKTEKFNRLKQTLQRITSEIARTGSVLRNLMKSVIQPDITRTPAMVNELVAESIQTAQEEGVFGYPVVTDYAVDLPLVKVNRLQLIKVLLNLIHNAAQAMHEATVANGKIWISTALAADGGEICIRVRDAGPGISTDLQAEVFEPFITTKSHGLGMGLTVSRALIEANGGKLWHSQDNGLGTTFHFTLPISS